MGFQVGIAVVEGMAETVKEVVTAEATKETATAEAYVRAETQYEEKCSASYQKKASQCERVAADVTEKRARLEEQRRDERQQRDERRRCKERQE